MFLLLLFYKTPQWPDTKKGVIGAFHIFSGFLDLVSNPQIVNWLLADCRCLERRHFRNLTKQPETENSSKSKPRYCLIKESQAANKPLYLYCGQLYIDCIDAECCGWWRGESTKEEELEKGGVVLVGIGGGRGLCADYLQIQIANTNTNTK